MPDLEALLNNPDHIVAALRNLRPASQLSLAFAYEISRTPGMTGILGVHIPADVNQPLDLALLTAPKTLMPPTMFGS